MLALREGASLGSWVGALVALGTADGAADGARVGVAEAPSANAGAVLARTAPQAACQRAQDSSAHESLSLVGRPAGTIARSGRAGH